MPTKREDSVSPGVCCVIVNWNGWRDTLDCLASLGEQDYKNLHVIVVDNGSTDDSVERIRAGFPEVSIVETGRNLGFPSGCNVGLRAALKTSAEYIWMLNNDTVCPPDTLCKLVRRGESQPDAGMIGTVLFYAHDPTKVQAWGGGHIAPMIALSTHFDKKTEFGPNTYLTFASVLVRREVFEEIGLLYGGFFMYYDDCDLCLRMQKTRWKIAMAEDTAVLHREGGSTPKGESPFMAKTVTVSGLRLILRQSPFAFFGIPAFALLRLGNRVAKGEWKSVPAVLRGILEFARDPDPERGQSLKKSN